VAITVNKRSKQRLTPTPESVTLVAPAGQPLPSRIVLIRDAENQPVIIEQISADEPAISCRWAAGPETMATVRIMVDRSRLRDGRTKGTLTVQTSRPVRQALTIPVSWAGE